MAANPLENFIDQEKIAGFIEAVNNDSSLEQQFVHPAINAIGDEHVRKVYVLMVLFAASVFMRSGLDDKSLLSKAFAVAKTISPNPLDAGEMKELMQQSITNAANNINQYAQDLRQHDLTLPLLFHLFHMTDGAMNSEIEKRLLQFADKFDMAATMRDVLNGSTPQERADNFNEKLNEQQFVQNDARRTEIRAKGRRLEESLSGASPRKRYTDLYLFYKENELNEDMLNYADALYSLELQDNNLPEATEWLLRAIQLNNSPERRARLLELYKKRCPNGHDPVEFAYQVMLADGIDGAREDYEAYRQQKGRHSTSPSSSSGCGTVVIILLVVAGVAWFFWPSSSGKQEKPASPPAVEQQQQKKEEKQEKQPTPVVAEEPRVASINAFRAYHENITKRNFQQAYSYFDKEMQDYFASYDNWVSGHQTTAKSNPYDIKVVSESPEKVVLAYSLQTVDNSSGEKTFDGKAVMVKTENGWKINDIENTLKQPAVPKPQPAPAAPPTASPKPAPAAPPTPPAPPEIEYRTFTENWYGFSFEYPASEGDFQQADSHGGQSAVEYWIDFPNNQGTVLAGTEFTNFSSADVDARNCADDNRSNDYEVLDATSYILTYRRGNETRIRKTFLVPSHYKDSTGFVRQYIEIRKRGKMSPQNQEIAQHMMDSFSPGE